MLLKESTMAPPEPRRGCGGRYIPDPLPRSGCAARARRLTFRSLPWRRASDRTRHLRNSMLSCLALIAALTACEDGTSPDVDEVVAITSSSPAFTPHPREDGDGHVISGEGTVVVGDSLRLIAADGAGNELEAKWSSSAPEVADVSSAGLVRGLSPGEAMITAETRSRRASARITVLPRSEDPPAPPPPPAVVAVEIRPDSVELSVGDTIGLVATAR